MASSSLLGSLCSRIGDGIHGTPQYVESSEYAFVNGNNLKGGAISIDERTKFVSRSEYEKYFIQFDGKTLLLSINGTIGGMAKYDGESIILGKSAAYFQCRDIDIDFLYYYLSQPEIVRHLYNIATGSTIKNLSLASLRALHVPTPPERSQKQIAAVLLALDSKISLNNRINAKLEALAKTIYDYWFVQFDFPDANGRPYKSSGGAMVWNDALRREIPAGWNAGSIRSIARLAGGGTPSKSNSAYWDGDIPFFTPADASDAMFQLDTSGHITQKGLDSCSSHAFDKGTVFITARGSVGKIVVAGRRMAMNQSCYALCLKSDSQLPFLYFHARTLVHHLKIKASGSTFNSIVTNDIEWTNLVIPASATSESFNVKTRHMFDRISCGLKENVELTQLRDWLLPLLMNGQVRVT